MVAVSLVPATSRPYVDGSSDNSLFEQVFVYNGLGRGRCGEPVASLDQVRAAIAHGQFTWC